MICGLFHVPIDLRYTLIFFGISSFIVVFTLA